MVGAAQDHERLRILRYLEEHPFATQRELARHLGVSLGKVNYCVRALIDKGLIKITNFRRNPNKLDYAYLLTPEGIEEKVEMTAQFLRRKVAEYEALSEEIELLRREMSPHQNPGRK